MKITLRIRVRYPDTKPVNWNTFIHVYPVKKMRIDIEKERVIISKVTKKKAHYMILRRKVDSVKGNILYKSGKKMYRIQGLKIYSFVSNKFLKIPVTTIPITKYVRIIPILRFEKKEQKSKVVEESGDEWYSDSDEDFDEEWPTVAEFITTLSCKQGFDIYDKLSDMNLDLEDKISPKQQLELRRSRSCGFNF